MSEPWKVYLQGHHHSPRLKSQWTLPNAIHTMLNSNHDDNTTQYNNTRQCTIHIADWTLLECDSACRSHIYCRFISWISSESNLRVINVTAITVIVINTITIILIIITIIIIIINIILRWSRLVFALISLLTLPITSWQAMVTGRTSYDDHNVWRSTNEDDHDNDTDWPTIFIFWSSM